MKEELNIAAILKDKPVGLKFYSPTFGRITFNGVHKGKVYFFSEDTNAHSVKQNGKMYDGGDCIIFPSKQMRDWSKFAWKKGDVLVNSRGLKILFDRWANDNYTSFYAKTINLVEDGFLDTNLHTLASEKEAKSFIKCIEEKLGGKLNRETLKIEKAQPEFKDGDILFYESGIDDVPNNTFILRGSKQPTPFCNYYACLDSNGFVISRNCHFTMYNEDFRLATDSEKQQLFEALAKENKKWNPDTLQIEDLPKKCEFKPMDWCLMRDAGIGGKWKLCQFGFFDEKEDFDRAPYNAIGGNWYDRCIPYNDQTKHLLGTTDEWKGGEENA